MKKMYYCKYCLKQMNVSPSQYKENSFCNYCLEERLLLGSSNKNKIATFGSFRPLKKLSNRLT